MLSLVKLKLCRVVHQGSVSNRYNGFYTVFTFRMFELVAAIQVCIQNWNTFPMIFTRKLNKINHRIEHSQKIISSYTVESTMNPFSLTNESLFPYKSGSAEGAGEESRASLHRSRKYNLEARKPALDRAPTLYKMAALWSMWFSISTAQ